MNENDPKVGKYCDDLRCFCQDYIIPKSYQILSFSDACRLFWRPVSICILLMFSIAQMLTSTLPSSNKTTSLSAAKLLIFPVSSSSWDQVCKCWSRISTRASMLWETPPAFKAESMRRFETENIMRHQSTNCLAPGHQVPPKKIQLAKLCTLIRSQSRNHDSCLSTLTFLEHHLWDKGSITGTKHPRRLQRSRLELASVWSFPWMPVASWAWRVSSWEIFGDKA